MVRLCITGGIGSGKSGVSELLRVRDVPVYDCDREAKRLMTADGAIRTALEQSLLDVRLNLKKVLILPPDFTRFHSNATCSDIPTVCRP